MSSTKFEKTIGSRIQVWKGVAEQTSGGLRKKDLRKSASRNKIVSKKMSDNAKANNYLGLYLNTKARKSAVKRTTPQKRTAQRTARRSAEKTPKKTPQRSSPKANTVRRSERLATAKK